MFNSDFSEIIYSVTKFGSISLGFPERLKTDTLHYHSVLMAEVLALHFFWLLFGSAARHKPKYVYFYTVSINCFVVRLPWLQKRNKRIVAKSDRCNFFPHIIKDKQKEFFGIQSCEKESRQKSEIILTPEWSLTHKQIVLPLHVWIYGADNRNKDSQIRILKSL